MRHQAMRHQAMRHQAMCQLTGLLLCVPLALGAPQAARTSFERGGEP